MILLVSLVSILMTGCSAATNSLRGKVIEGNLSFVCVVSQSDERLKTQGIDGATVEARASNTTGTLFASTKSRNNGDFTLRFGDQQAVLLKPIEFSGAKDGYTQGHEVLNLPPSDRVLLVVLKPGATAHPPASR
jgi:hypothetical protein